MHMPAFTASLTAPSPDTSMLFDVSIQADGKTNNDPVTYNQYFPVAIVDDVSQPLLTSELRQTSAKDHTYSASIIKERTVTAARTKQSTTDDIALDDNTSAIVIVTDDQPLPSTSLASDETYLLITPGSYQTRQTGTTTPLPLHVMTPVAVPVVAPNCSAIDHGNNLDSFIRSVTNKQGELYSTPITDNYFATVSEEQYKQDTERFIKKLKSKKEKDKYKKTLQKVRRKFKNKKSAEKARRNKEALKDMLYGYAVETQKVIHQSRNLVRELRNHCTIPDVQRNEALISTLGRLEEILESAPNINL